MKLKGSSKILLGIIGVIGCILLLHTARMVQIKGQMEQFLKKEYGKEFVVNGVHYVYQYLGGSLLIRGTAYPKDDPSLKFEIGRNANDNIFLKNKTYRETYIQDLWEKQKKEELQSLLKTDLIWPSIAAYYKEAEIYGRTINISEAEKIFKNRIELYISYGMLIDFVDFKKQFNTFKNYTEKNLDKNQAESLYLMIKKLQNSNYKEIDLEITYFNNIYNEKIKKDTKGYLTGKVLYFFELSSLPRDAVLCRFRVDDINRIQKPEDIVEFINPKASYLFQN